MSAETYVQVAPDSTGKKIRNLQITTYVPDPTTGRLQLATVLLQVTSIADEHGNVISNFADVEFQMRVLELLEQIRDGISFLIREPLGS